ncbi:major facilitator superfamily domain-containing protein [Dactylonectria estremocensis]|uniref:Major facilitator superfamily domain-containing protein n=1 Tax=Dactylonectria estremocensis TaxID=1079267 RepID=A0A9P9FKL5_9HYPO|nr:major facilitator superfamily domain-containing protein [Dactylonectria estremocensis]
MSSLSKSQSAEKDTAGHDPIASIHDEDSPGTSLAALEPVQTGTSYKPPAMKTWHRRLVMFSLCLTLFLGALDITIIATALPTIAEQLHVTAQEYAWIGSGYTLATTASTPVWAKLSDIFGRKATIMTTTTIFMLGSLVCALANSSTVLIAGRVVQGLGGGGSLVLVTIIIGDLFSLADRAKYYGLTGIVFGIASAVGPVLGGVFTQAVNWRWCFYINLPFDGVALIVLFFALKVETEKEPILEGLRTLDWTGFALIIGGTICFLYGLEAGSGGLAPWGSAKVICLIVFGLLILALFMVWEARFAKNPVIPIRIFQKTTNIASFAVSCLHSFIFISYDFFLPLYFQAVLGFRPIISGVTLFALILPLSVMTLIGGLITRKTGNFVIIIIAGTVLMTLGNGLFISLGAETNWPKIIIFQLLAGSGAGVLFQSPMIALQSHLHHKDMAAAMSAYSFLRSLFTSVSIVIGTVLIQRSIGSGSLTAIHGEGVTDKKDYVKALHVMWGFYTATAGLMIVAACFIKQTRTKKQPSEAVTDANPQLEAGRIDVIEPGIEATNEKTADGPKDK